MRPSIVDWISRVISIGKAIVHVQQSQFQVPLARRVSLVEVCQPRGADDAPGGSDVNDVSNRYICWDALPDVVDSRYVGRFTRLDRGHRVVYMPLGPTCKRGATLGVEQGRAKFSIPSTCVNMVRAQSPQCFEMPGPFRLRTELHDYFLGAEAALANARASNEME